MIKNRRYHHLSAISIVTIIGLSPFICHAESCQSTMQHNSDIFSNYQSHSYQRAPNSKFREIAFCPEKYDHHFYGRLSTNFSQFDMNSLSSSSGEISMGGASRSLPAGAIQTDSISFLRPRTEIAIGYLWCYMRVEAEFLINSRMNTNANVTLNSLGLVPPNSNSSSMNIKLDNKTYLANVYYDYPFSERIRPFITCGLGLAVNRLTLHAQNSFSNILSTAKQRVDLAYAGGLGIRFRIFPYCFITASYRYISLGTPETEIVSNSSFGASSIRSLKFDGNLNQNTISVGLMYLI